MKSNCHTRRSEFVHRAGRWVKTVVRSLSLLGGALLLAPSSSCCVEQARESPPERPSSVRGWSELHVYDFLIVAELVLRKGESSDNGSLGVEVVDIVAADPCAERYSRNGTTRVLLRFFRPASGETLCEAEFPNSAAGMPEGPACATRFDIDTVNVYAINAEDEWVWFDLRR